MINYYLMTKPGIIMGNLITLAAGFLLASKGNIDYKLFFAVFMGLIFVIASACVFNNYIDRAIDKKMERTKNRALAQGLIQGRNAILFGTILGIIGGLILFFFTNLLTLAVTASGFFIYVILYSFWKSRTIYGTAIGSIAGAVPPVAGYCAASNELDAGALVLFLMLVLWQMPHFFSIAIFHLKDYAAAGIPVLPVERGMLRTKVHMAIYIVCFIASAAMLTFLNYTGYAYLTVAAGIGLAWLGLCLKGFSSTNDTLWGKQMFRLSLVLITAICFVIPFDLAAS
jgi:protoheme IX farnesyltransferase